MNKRILNNFYILIRYNWMTLILFELLHKGLILIAIMPFINYMLSSLMKSANIIYLSTDNITKILTNPISIILILLIILALAFYIFFELTSIIICFDKSIKFSKIGLIELIKESLKRSIRIIYTKNILLIAFVIFIVPLTNLVLTSGFIGRIKLPEYIIDYIYSNNMLNILYIILMLGIYILAIRWIFSIHEITLNTDSFKEARQKSISLTKGKIFKIFIYSTGLFMLTAIIGYIISYVIIILIGLLTKHYIGNVDHAKNIFISRTIIFKDYAIFISSVIQFIVSIGFLSAIYYEYNQVYGCNLKELRHKKPKDSIIKNIFRLSIIFLGICIESFTFSLNNVSPFNTEFLYNTTATAHRASSITAPENTIAALKEAIISQAEYVEIDVQETKDGELIIIHDSNFKRTTGIDKNVWEVDYDEVKTYDTGSYFSVDFKGEKIPTLDEVIKNSKGKIKLLIEIKANEHANNMEQKVIDLIKKNNFENQCVIASMSKDVLQKIKKIDPNLKTCYISAIAYGNFYDWDYVNIYAIESTFVNKNIIDKIHNSGKQIFVWTINDKNLMKKMIDLNVDSIITDNPFLVNDVIYWNKNGFVNKVADYLFN
ncbi:glycerophosphodiester phosphodiesterase [uncultured Clostridium sp.]|uniref:glycerophosphodiester phosphodiesterase n=1 Tax=uncultured Clostridium sp. TaxID=59620 RepID=UPI0028E995BA|nr:glycerophosphodiester phosphodiesterase [uncultured Clostridium sp.]